MELAKKEHKLEEELQALDHQGPVNEMKRGASEWTKIPREEKIRAGVEDALCKVRKQIHGYLTSQEKKRDQARKIMRVPSKALSAIFKISVDAVNQRASRVNKLLGEHLEKELAPHER